MKNLTQTHSSGRLYTRLGHGDSLVVVSGYRAAADRFVTAIVIGEGGEGGLPAVTSVPGIAGAALRQRGSGKASGRIAGLSATRHAFHPYRIRLLLCVRRFNSSRRSLKANPTPKPLRLDPHQSPGPSCKC